jgi:poly(beta-D-mannuronate) lyase
MNHISNVLSTALVGFAIMIPAGIAQDAPEQDQPPATEREEAVDNFKCNPVPDPVISLAFGSRYTDESKDRSDIDEQSNAEVNKALKPVERYISALSRMANAAIMTEEHRAERIACVSTWLWTWADAGALTSLESSSAKLSVSPRLSGLAFAYGQVKSAGTIDAEHAATIEPWLTKQAGTVVRFFDEEAPEKASKNNLRLWAGLAATEIGIVVNNPGLVEWGRATNEMVACAANADGSLPLEMGRGALSLHYQLHALGPLVVTASLLEDQGIPAFEVCGSKIAVIVDFTLKAVKDPTIVDGIAGEPQSYSAGKEKLEPFEMAWAEPYLSRFENPDLEAFVAPLRPMSHAKLGGNLTAIYRYESDPPDGQ